MTNSLWTTVAVSAALVAFLPLESGRAEEAVHPLPVPADRAKEGQPLPIGIMLDFARILTFEQPARTIIIGNPGIVDGALSDEKTIVLTGKGIGTTNMIVLGEGGMEIANFSINVASNNRQLTTIHLGANQQVFSCAGPCKPLATPAAK